MVIGKKVSSYLAYQTKNLRKKNSDNSWLENIYNIYNEKSISTPSPNQITKLDAAKVGRCRANGKVLGKGGEVRQE